MFLVLVEQGKICGANHDAPHICLIEKLTCLSVGGIMKKKNLSDKEWIPSKKHYFKSVIGYLILLWSIIFVFRASWTSPPMDAKLEETYNYSVMSYFTTWETKDKVNRLPGPQRDLLNQVKNTHFEYRGF
jgi:hypothetical protein